MKNLLIIVVTITMFFFKSSSHADYEKIFYDFKINSISGDIIDLNDFKGKPVLVVNTASYCGFTKQYDELQELWDLYKSKGDKHELQETFNTVIKGRCKSINKFRKVDFQWIEPEDKYSVVGYLNKETSSNHLSIDPYNSLV